MSKGLWKKIIISSNFERKFRKRFDQNYYACMDEWTSNNCVKDYRGFRLLEIARKSWSGERSLFKSCLCCIIFLHGSFFSSKLNKKTFQFSFRRNMWLWIRWIKSCFRTNFTSPSCDSLFWRNKSIYPGRIYRNLISILSEWISY